MFLYTGDYADEVKHRSFDDDPELLKHVRVYFLAEMFLIHDLKVMAWYKFQDAMYRLDIHDSSFYDCVCEVYDGPFRKGCEMRKTVVDTLIQQVEGGEYSTDQETKMLRSNVLQLEHVKKLFEDCGSFAIDFATVQDSKRISALALSEHSFWGIKNVSGLEK
ncbi:hypothetical protein K3495_g15841 [Podosphaera aphanis]|nr:hypothetical protein K3495_g15841 [Podosphaera aphanis]